MNDKVVIWMEDEKLRNFLNCECYVCIKILMMGCYLVEVGSGGFYLVVIGLKFEVCEVKIYCCEKLLLLFLLLFLGLICIWFIVYSFLFVCLFVLKIYN